MDVLLLYTHDIAAWVVPQGGQNGDHQEAVVHLVPSMEIMDIFKQTLNIKLHLDKEIWDAVPKYLIINSRMDNAIVLGVGESLTSYRNNNNIQIKRRSSLSALKNCWVINSSVCPLPDN